MCVCVCPLPVSFMRRISEPCHCSNLDTWTQEYHVSSSLVCQWEILSNHIFFGTDPYPSHTEPLRLMVVKVVVGGYLFNRNLYSEDSLDFLMVYGPHKGYFKCQIRCSLLSRASFVLSVLEGIYIFPTCGSDYMWIRLHTHSERLLWLVSAEVEVTQRDLTLLCIFYHLAILSMGQPFLRSPTK